MSKENLVTDGIKYLIKRQLSDIGECINGRSIAYTRRRSIHSAMRIDLPSAVIESIPIGDFESLSASLICGMVRSIECYKFLDVKRLSKGPVFVVFRSLSITKDGDNIVFYVRCAIESEDQEEHEMEDYESIPCVDAI